MKELNHIPNSGIEIYTNPDNSVQLEVRLDGEAVWLTQKQIAMLFDVKTPAISKHLKNIFREGELQEDEVVSKMETVQIEGNRTIIRLLDYYNLDMILSVGYRVNSKNAIAFRQWSNKVLKEYIIKGYAINEKIKLQRYEELKEVVSLMSRTISMQECPVVISRTLCAL